jgi:hypothetical protein
VILDPDEFFLRPLTTTGRAREDMLSHWPKSMVGVDSINSL